MLVRFTLIIACLRELWAQGPGTLIDPAVFDGDYCATKPATAPRTQELNIASMDCGKLMEFMYVTRQKIHDELERQKTECEDPTFQPAWKTLLRIVSRATSLMSAHTHFLAALSSQRKECFSEHVRLLLIVHLRRMRAMKTGHMKQLWMFSQNGPEPLDEVFSHTKKWLGEAEDLFAVDLRTMSTVLRTWRPPLPEEARFYSHETDGRFSTIEALRRDTFEEWQLDKGLLRALIRQLPIDSTVADFGAGSGHYASWLNDTGLVTAYAFDGSPDIELVTKNAVKSADLGRPFTLWQKFDWTLCLEVAENIPPELTPAFLRNLDAHSEHGLILSWAKPDVQGLGTANPRSEAEVLKLMQEHTGLHLDTQRTHTLRTASTVPYLADSLLAFVRNPSSATATCAPGDSTCQAGDPCGTEAGVIFAGNDIQMYPNVPTPAACCELCRSHDTCRYWSWSQEESHKDLCWIKSNREVRISHEGFISGVRPA